MVLLDGLGIGVCTEREVIRSIKVTCEAFLISQCPEELRVLLKQEVAPPLTVREQDAGEMELYSRPAGSSTQGGHFRMGTFSVALGGDGDSAKFKKSSNFILSSDNTVINIWRVLRAMQIPRPILLEGPPVSFNFILPSNI